MANLAVYTNLIMSIVFVICSLSSEQEGVKVCLCQHFDQGELNVRTRGALVSHQERQEGAFQGAPKTVSVQSRHK